MLLCIADQAGETGGEPRTSHVCLERGGKTGIVVGISAEAVARAVVSVVAGCVVHVVIVVFMIFPGWRIRWFDGLRTNTQPTLEICREKGGEGGEKRRHQ